MSIYTLQGTKRSQEESVWSILYWYDMKVPTMSNIRNIITRTQGAKIASDDNCVLAVSLAAI